MDLSAQPTTEKEIVKLSIDKYRWYTENKIDAVENLYDDDLVFIHITAHISNKKEWIGEMRSGSFVYNQINIKEASARCNLIYTEVYTKKNDKWKLVNVHTTSGY